MNTVPNFQVGEMWRYAGRDVYIVVMTDADGGVYFVTRTFHHRVSRWPYRSHLKPSGIPKNWELLRPRPQKKKLRTWLDKRT